MGERDEEVRKIIQFSIYCFDGFKQKLGELHLTAECLFELDVKFLIFKMKAQYAYIVAWCIQADRILLCL